jgi:hypothetical protein
MAHSRLAGLLPRTADSWHQRLALGSAYGAVRVRPGTASAITPQTTRAGETEIA